MALDRAAVIERMHAIAVEIAERPLPTLTEDKVIAELGLDSLSTLEMVGTLERELSIRLPTDELGDIHTVGELIDLIESKLAAM